MLQDSPTGSPREFTGAEIGALAHLYRGEVYRSTVWRTRLDNTTNWAVAALGLAMSASYAHPSASALPLVLIGVLIVVFLIFEARRYRYFSVWRARARWLETNFYAALLRGEGSQTGANWEEVLAKDYCEPRHHITMLRAVGRRLRRTYAWLLGIQALAFLGKLAIHPTSATSIDQFVERAAIGPIPGWAMLLCGLVFYSVWIAIGVCTWRVEMRGRASGRRITMG